MSGISDDVRKIVRELDADGGGFHTSEAAGLLVHQYVAQGICDADGDPKPKVRALMRLGAGVAFKGYKSESQEERKQRERAAASVGGVQRDFVEMHDDFEFEWLRVYAAWDESETASRKMLLRMTLPEVLLVIALKDKKADEATAVANRLRDIIAKNPHWRRTPSLSLADIVGIYE